MSKKPFKYDFSNKRGVFEEIAISEVTGVDSHLDSYLAGKIDDVTLKVESDILKVALPFRRIDSTDERVESTGTIAENTAFNFTSANVGTETNINASLYWTGALQQTHGTLNFIGKSSTNNWTNTNSQQITITAETGSWFNIKNNAGGSVSNHKNIKTDAEDIFGVIKAVLSYSDSQSVWILESYELLGSATVQTDFSSTTASGNIVTKNITVPRAGLYSVHAYFITEEKDAGGVPVYTQNSQLLDLKCGGGTYKNVDLSGNFAIGVGGAPYWYNHSVQGSCFVQVSASDLTIYAQITMPNGTQQRIVTGYMHANFISI